MEDYNNLIDELDKVLKKQSYVRWIADSKKIKIKLAETIDKC